MSTVAILGTLGALVDLYDKADSVINRFTYNPKIAPRELCRLYFLLKFLQDHDAHVGAPEEKLRRLKELLRECESLIKQYDPEQADNYDPVSCTWPKVAETRLRSLINDIDEELLRLRFYIPGQGDQKDPVSWQSLDLPSSLASIGASKSLREDRRESLNSFDLPVTIMLRGNIKDNRGQRFQLRWVNIVERDKNSRTLQYRSDDETVIISHRISKGQLPFVEDKLDATHVYFNEPQKIIVQTDRYEAYKNIYPQYQFTKPKDLDIFIQKVRERTLVGKYHPDRIYPNKKKRQPLARCKVVRLWARNMAPASKDLGLQPQTEVTLTFENTAINQQIEEKLTDFNRPAQLIEKDLAVEISTSQKTAQKTEPDKITFLFQKEDKKCARQLYEDFNVYHPHAPQPPQQSDGEFKRWGQVTLPTNDLTPPSESGRKSSMDSAPGMTDTMSIVSLWPDSPIGGLRRSHESHSRIGSTTQSIPEPPTPSPKTNPLRPIDTPPPFFLEMRAPRNKREFEVAVICALTIEADAVVAAFDHRWEYDYDPVDGDSNTYTYGSIGQHHIVLVYMAGTGKIHAATAASHCCRSFRGIKLCLVVGVCGGVPESSDHDKIWLGDVAISDGIVEYDYGRLYENKFVLKDSRNENLPRASNQVTSLLRKLRGRQDRKLLQGVALRHLDAMKQDSEFAITAQYPESAEDVLFRSSYQHKHRAEARCHSCEPGPHSTDKICDIALKASCTSLNCDSSQVVRQRSKDQGPKLPAVHFGHYASGDIVMKSGKDRNNLAQDKDIIAFEMEGAAAWDSFSRCLVIKGICDYVDSHKNKLFQKYAAATAAAYTKAFLEKWRCVSQ